MAYSLTELQVAILQVLWNHGEATVVGVQDELGRPLAQSTVATLLSRLEKKGLVAHRTAGRQYVYRALVDERAVRRSMVDEFASLADDLFSGDVAAMVSHLLTARDVQPDELARMKALIEQRQRALEEGDDQ